MSIHAVFTFVGYLLANRKAFLISVVNRQTTIFSWITASTCFALLATGTVFAAPGGPTGTNGAYKVICGGSYEGTGTAAVGAQNVNVVLHLTNPETGVSGTLHISNMAMDNGRFSGTGTFAGKSVTLSGRVEAPDGQVVTKARICGTFAISDGLHGRFAGNRNGP
jgi:hypothetical protein